MAAGTEDLLVRLLTPFCYLAEEIYPLVLLDLGYFRQGQPVTILLDDLGPVGAHFQIAESVFAAGFVLPLV